MRTAERSLSRLKRVAQAMRQEEEMMEGALPSPFGFGQLGAGSPPPRKLSAPEVQQRFRRFVEAVPAAEREVADMDAPEVDDLVEAALLQADVSARQFAQSVSRRG